MNKATKPPKPTTQTTKKKELPVYGAARRLFLQLQASTKKTPVNMKRTKVSEIECEVFDMMYYINKANNKKENPTKTLEYIRKAIDLQTEAKIKVRVLLDLRMISQDGFSALTKLEGMVIRQLELWENATRQRIKELENKQN